MTFMDKLRSAWRVISKPEGPDRMKLDAFVRQMNQGPRFYRMCGGTLGASRVVRNDESTTTHATFLVTMLRGGSRYE